MFLRIVKARGRKEEKHESFRRRMVETYRADGQAKQQVVMNLGRKDLLAPYLNSLVRILGGEGGTGEWIRDSEVQPDEAAYWGGVLVAQHLWQELGLDVIMDGGQGKKATGGASLAERGVCSGRQSPVLSIPTWNERRPTKAST